MRISIFKKKQELKNCTKYNYKTNHCGRKDNNY